MHRRSTIAPNLQRGQACMHCRRRKMRCDGGRPVCGQCSRGNRVDDCQYTDAGQTRMEMLEESIAKVEARIKELENPNALSAPVMLHQPYTPHPQQQSRSSNEEAWWSLPEPPHPMRAGLIDSFLAYASEFGFFLHPRRFRESALGSRSIGHASRPLPALLSTAYLFGAALSGHAAHHGTFLSRALAQVSASLSGTHPQKVMHTLQAEILLAFFLFSSGRFLEGKYHVSVAVSLGTAAGLQKIRSGGGGPPIASPIPPAKDPVEEGERVDACWVTFVVDKCWAVALAAPPNLVSPSPFPGGQCDTPWPLEVEDYENGGYPLQLRSSYTIETFLKGNPSLAGNENSTKSLLVKAALLWERSNDCVSRWKAEMSQTESQKFYSAFNAFDRLLDILRNSLTPPNQLQNRTPDKMRALFLAHNITFAAIMQLHGLFATSATSRQKVILSAKTVFQMAGAVGLGSMTQIINPVIGAVWVTASQNILEEISSLRYTRGRRPPTREEQELVAIFESGWREIMPLGQHSVLLRYQLSQIQEAYAAI